MCVHPVQGEAVAVAVGGAGGVEGLEKVEGAEEEREGGGAQEEVEVVGEVVGGARSGEVVDEGGVGEEEADEEGRGKSESEKKS